MLNCVRNESLCQNSQGRKQVCLQLFLLCNSGASDTAYPWLEEQARIAVFQADDETRGDVCRLHFEHSVKWQRSHSSPHYCVSGPLWELGNDLDCSQWKQWVGSTSKWNSVVCGELCQLQSVGLHICFDLGRSLTPCVRQHNEQTNTCLPFWAFNSWILYKYVHFFKDNTCLQCHIVLFMPIRGAVEEWRTEVHDIWEMLSNCAPRSVQCPTPGRWNRMHYSCLQGAGFEVSVCIMKAERIRIAMPYNSLVLFHSLGLFLQLVLFGSPFCHSFFVL